jgi:probable HAF family extracellular repeat protein
MDPVIKVPVPGRLDRRGRNSIAVTLLGLLAATAVGSGHGYAQCGYDVTIIQGPEDDYWGFPLTIATGLNDLGDVVGYYYYPNSYDRAFLWTPDPGLTTLEMPSGTRTSSAYDVSNGGQIVGTLDIIDDGLSYLAFVFDGEALEVLGTLPSGNFSEGLAINGVGVVAGYWGNSSSGPIHGFVWEGGVMNDLGPILGTPGSRAYDIGQNGQLTGWMGSSVLSDARAFVLMGGEVIELPTIPGGFTSMGRAINMQSEVAVEGLMDLPDKGITVMRSALWNGEAMVDLGTLPGLTFTRARDINDQTHIVGTCNNLGLSDLTAFLWQDGQILDLNDLIPPSLNMNLKIASALNASGQIAGRATDQHGDSVAVLLTPVDPPLGDLDHDCTVGFDDFLILLNAWGPCPQSGACPADVNFDGTVSVLDFLIMLANWTV